MMMVRTARGYMNGSWQRMMQRSTRGKTIPPRPNNSPVVKQFRHLGCGALRNALHEQSANFVEDIRGGAVTAEI
jgi:hypothetical protein